MHNTNGTTDTAATPHNGKLVNAPPAPQSVFRGLSPAIVAHTVKRSLWWTLPVGVLLAIAASTGVWYSVPYRYEAKAWIKIAANRQKVAFDLEESRLYVRTQVELIKSPLILREVVRRPAVAKLAEIQRAVAPLEFIQKNMTVRSVGGSELYTIGYNTKTRANAPVVANAILQAYLEKQPEYVDRQIDDTVALLEREKSRKAEDLAELRERLKTIASQMNLTDPVLIGDPTSSLLMTAPYRPMADLNNRLGELEFRRSTLLAKQAAAQTLLTQIQNDELSTFQQIRAVESDPQVARFSNQRLMATVAIAKYEERGYGKDHPRMQSLLADIERLDTLLVERREAAKADAIQTYKSKIMREHQDRLREFQTELAQLAISEEMINENITEEKNKLLKTGDRSLEFAFALQEVTRAEDVHALISGRIQVLQTEMGGPSRIERLRDATADTVHTASSPIKMMVAASSGAFIVPFLLALVFELRARHLSFADQLASETDLPVLAEVSRVPTRLVSGRERKLGLRRAMFEESIDQLRISLLMAEKAQGKKVFSMSSSVSGEGKTSIASQLALSIARSQNLPVLLIDADMRAPSQHNIFECNIGPGLTDVFDGTATLDEAIIQWDDFVSILPAGELTRNPNALLTYESFTALLEKVRDDYSYILIDCPPLLAATEAYVIARVADGALLCCMRDVSRTLQVRKAYERLIAVGCDVMGLILSGVPTYDYAYRYGGYSRYYKKYYRQEFAENTQ
jgi:capsular exopolysaccharide synthesis family protein